MGLFSPLLAQQEDLGGAEVIILVVYFGVIILTIAGIWATYAKAGKPGWASIIPIYNIIVLLEMAGKPIWWLLLFFIPIVSLIVYIMVLVDVSRAFGKGALYGVGLAFLPFIFFPMLGFGDAEYAGP
jgi:hypothetical protein